MPTTHKDTQTDGDDCQRLDRVLARIGTNWQDYRGLTIEEASQLADEKFGAR